MNDTTSYREGYVVVKRAWKPIQSGRRGGRMRIGWTLHDAGCGYLNRAKRTVIPAPVVPYPDTIPCIYCRPDSGHTPRRVHNADGTITITCQCGAQVSAANADTARVRLRRWHEQNEPEGQADGRASA